MPAAAVIPAPIAYIKVVAVKKRSTAFGPPQRGFRMGRSKAFGPPKGSRTGPF